MDWQVHESGHLPTMETLLGRHVRLKGAEKLGEGMYGEAFRAEGTVLKIIPIDGSCLVNGWPQMQSCEVLREASISLALSGLREAGGFDVVPSERPPPPPPFAGCPLFTITHVQLACH